jgi:hypothetical protein
MHLLVALYKFLSFISADFVVLEFLIFRNLSINSWPAQKKELSKLTNRDRSANPLQSINEDVILLDSNEEIDELTNWAFGEFIADFTRIGLILRFGICTLLDCRER